MEHGGDGASKRDAYSGGLVDDLAEEFTPQGIEGGHSQEEQ